MGASANVSLDMIAQTHAVVNPSSQKKGKIDQKTRAAICRAGFRYNLRMGRPSMSSPARGRETMALNRSPSMLISNLPF